MPVRTVGTMMVLCSALALGACGSAGDSPAAGNNASADRPTTLQGAFNKGFVDKFKPAFVKSCVQSAQGVVGITAAQVQKVCDCTADDLIHKYSVSELMKLTPEQGKPSAEKCAKSVGLEPR